MLHPSCHPNISAKCEPSFQLYPEAKWVPRGKPLKLKKLKKIGEQIKSGKLP